MPSEVILPRVDMDMATGKIAKWFVENGAQVTKGQPLFEIETDKAAMEIEAPASGTLRHLASASAADIPVGSVVAWIDGADEAASGSQPQPSPAAVAQREAEAPGSDGASPPLRNEAPEHEGQAAEDAGDPARPRATPMARRLARVHNLDLAALTGSGPRGRIQAVDVTAASAAAAPAVITSTPAGTMGAAAAASAVAPIDLDTEPAVSATAGRAMTRNADPLNLVHLREGEGRPTLLIHGFGADANTWRPFLSGRSGTAPVFALDLPGHGASPLGAVTFFDTLVDAVEAALLGRDLPTFDLVGHSLGGAVAAALAARATLDIRSLMLLSPAGLGPEVNGAFLRGFLGATSEASLTPWMHELVVDPATITAAFVRATLKARNGTDVVAAQRRIVEAVFPDDTQSFSIRADLARLTIPTRVVIGTADRILPAKQAAGLPGPIALHLFGNVGHMPQFEARDAVARIAADMAR